MLENKITKVKKRDGTIVDFDQSRITNAIFKAITATDQGDGQRSKKLSDKVIQLLTRRFKKDEIPQVEQIQDIVEEVLILEGLVETAKAYILYREQRRRIREAVAIVDESTEAVDKYLQELDWQVHENANMTYSLQGLNQYSISTISKKYWLNKIYPKEIREAANQEDFHIHNLEVLAPYCAGWDLYDLLLRGFGGVPGKIESKPPKHFRTALGQLVNFLFTLQGETAGANAVSNFDTLIAPFIRYDNLNYLQVKQAIQEFLFNCMVPTRVGFQSLAWNELVVTRDKGKIKFVEIGKLIDEKFEKNSHRIIEQHPQSFAIENYDDCYTLSFDSQGKAVWAKVKAFVRHRVPKNTQFLKIRTNRGEALVSPAHSLFAFEKFNGKFNPQPVSASDVKVAYNYRQLNPKNHFLALSKLENGENKEELDLVELIDEFPQLQRNVFVKINPTHTLSQIKGNILNQYQALHPFYVDFGIKDKGVWQDWLKRKSIRYDIWRKFGEDSDNVRFRLKNSNIWYPRILRGEILEAFVKLIAWYAAEGHKGMSVPILVSQANLKNKKEILKILKKLNNLGEVQENQGYSKKGNKVQTVYKITAKGLLAEIISLSSGILAFNKVIPWYIFILSKNLQKIFIENLLKGEATEYENHWDISTSSKKLSLSLSLLLAQNDIRFSVYTEKISEKNKNWRDKLITRVFKNSAYYGKKQYKVGDFEARVCLGKEKVKYDKEYEYDISVDLPQENFAGGNGLLIFHNTPFLNVTLDIEPPGFLAKQPVIIGGKPQEETYGEFREEINIFNRAFYEGLMEGDAKGRPFTFPIPTVSITKEFDWENPALEPMWEATAKYGVNYFQNFVQSDMKPEDFRSMCITPDTQIIYQNTLGNIGKMPIRRIVEDFIKMENFGKVLMNGEFVEIKNVLRLVNKAGYVLKIILENGESFRVTPDHPSMIVKGNKLVEVQSEKLKAGDEIPIAKNPYKGELGDFDLGRFVGLYIAEGYLAHSGATTAFSFGLKEKNYFDFVTKFVQERFGARTTAKIEQKHQSLVAVINDRATGVLVKSYVRGDNSLNKRLSSRLFGKSFEFRKGVLIGVLEGDGYISKKDITHNIRIDSSNSRLIDDVGLLCRSLGINYTKHVNLNNTHFGIKFTSYELLLTNDFPEWLGKYFNRKPGKSRIYKNYKNFYGVKIKSIEKNPYADQVYDFETKNKEHLFQLANGVITHNCCRLRLSNKELYKRGGGLFGSAPLTGCYDEKTDILTENGWKPFKDLTKNENIFTLTENNKIELHRPTRLFQYDYRGEMYQFKTKSLDLLVTPNHRMVVDNRRKNQREFVEAKDFKPDTHWIPKQGIWEGKEEEYFELPPVIIMGGAGPASHFSEEEIGTIRKMKREGESIYQIAGNFKCNPVTVYNICTIAEYGNRERVKVRYEAPALKIKMDNWLKFFGFWIAEGCTDNEEIALDHGYRVTITQVNQEKRKEIKKVLGLLPFNYYEEGPNFVITNKQLWTYLRQFGNKYEKFIPQEVKNLSKRQLRVLFDWLVKGDGHIRKTTGQINYWTSSRKLADDLQEIILKLGWLGTLTAQQKKVSQIKGRKIKAGIVYTIGVQETKHYRLRKNNSQKVYYEGKVYCCEVPNHTVFVRRNGRVAWCGNSIGVVTINMPRIGHLSKTKKDFFERLGHLMDLARESLEIKRKALENFMEKGLYPYSRYYLSSVKKLRDAYFGNHFATIGLMGMNEALLNFIGENIGSKRGRKFALEVMDFMRERLIKYQEKTGNLYNLEATPGEGTSYRQARTDKEMHPDIITAGTKETPYYTNSSQLPVNYTDDIFEALKLQDELQCRYTGGCVEKGNKVLTDKGLIKIEDIAENFERLKPIKTLSYNKEKKIGEWDEIMEAVKIDVKKHNKIRITGERNLDITTSDWHPFFILEKFKPNPACPICEEKVQNLKAFATHIRWNPQCKKEYQVFPKYRVVEKRADELKIGDYILQNSSNLYPEKETELDGDLMWLIGFFVGDGCISKFIDNRGGNNLERYKVRFFSEHQEALEKVADILNNYFHCGVKVIRNEKRSKLLKEVSTSKREVSEFFFEYGFWDGKKVYKACIPQKVKENLTKGNVYSLLSGLLDSDGDISKRDGDVGYSTVSAGLAEDILEICTRAGIMLSKERKPTKRKNEVDGFRLRIPVYEATRIKDKLTITVNSSRIREDISNRKKRYLPVVRVEEVSKVDVKDNQFYDLMTKRNHNYLAGKDCLVFIHNTVLHLFLGERISDPQVAKNLVKKVFENFHLPYLTLTPTFSICPAHGYIAGEHFFCPQCTIKQPCEVYSRIVGYLRPVSQWNAGKQEEFKERKEFKIRKTELVAT